eukprot:6465191-Amphidinium_carterae.2
MERVLQLSIAIDIMATGSRDLSGKGEKSEDTTRRQADSAAEDSTAEYTAAREQPQEQESRGTHTATAVDTAATDVPQAKPRPCMTRVVPTAGGSSLLPADDQS